MARRDLVSCGRRAALSRPSRAQSRRPSQPLPCQRLAGQSACDPFTPARSTPPMASYRAPYRASTPTCAVCSPIGLQSACSCCLSPPGQRSDKTSALALKMPRRGTACCARLNRARQQHLVQLFSRWRCRPVQRPPSAATSRRARGAAPSGAATGQGLRLQAPTLNLARTQWRPHALGRSNPPLHTRVV